MDETRLKAMLGANVKSLREKRGISQEQLAETIDRSWQAISHIETGKSLPPLTTLGALASALGVSLRDLLSEDGLPTSDLRADLLSQAYTALADLDDRELETAVKVLRALWEGRR